MLVLVAVVANLGAFALFTGASKMCAYAVVELGPKGVGRTRVVVGNGPTNNVII